MQPDCLFCRMASGDLQVARVAENSSAFAVRDINPRAPIHDLIIPKAHISDARSIEWGHAEILASMFALAIEVARTEGVFEPGYRLAFNVGEAAGMTIPHLHLHLLGGRRLGPEG
jgi:histidine triad (HIT) family protein